MPARWRAVMVRARSPFTSMAGADSRHCANARKLNSAVVRNNKPGGKPWRCCQEPRWSSNRLSIRASSKYSVTPEARSSISMMHYIPGGIDHILVRHEQAAVHMADGLARATGEVGVVLVTSGPGATNAITGIATAYMDSVPLVILSGQVATSLIGYDAFRVRYGRYLPTGGETQFSGQADGRYSRRAEKRSGWLPAGVRVRWLLIYQRYP